VRQDTEVSTETDGKTTGWDKTSVFFQGIAAFAIPVSVVALLVGVNQFKQQQKDAASQALNQQYQATLNNYINDISALTLYNKLSHPPPGSPVGAIAVARTDTAVRNLDGARKGILIRYLWEAGLIRGPRPVVYLHNVNLDGAVFTNAYLYGANLSTDSLDQADFYGADLHGADLRWAHLNGATLIRADLSCYNGNQIDYAAGLGGAARIENLLAQEDLRSLGCTDLTNATLKGADLSRANLIGANLSGASMAGAKLTGAMYNSKSLTFPGANGKPLTIKPTQWPAPARRLVAREAFCVDC
jgi:Pentapeptide repeats (8 copies)